MSCGRAPSTLLERRCVSCAVRRPRPPRRGAGGAAPRRRTLALPAREVGGVVGLRRLDDAQPLLLAERRHSSSERFAHAIRVVGRVDDEQVDGPDVAAGDDRRTQDEHRPADELAPDLGDEDAGVRQVDELAEEVGGDRAEPASPDASSTRDAERDEPIDVRDPGRSDRDIPRRSMHLCRVTRRADPARSRSEGAARGAEWWTGRRARERSDQPFPGRWRTSCILVAGRYDTASLGGYLRAVRARSLRRSVTHRSLPWNRRRMRLSPATAA